MVESLRQVQFLLGLYKVGFLMKYNKPRIKKIYPIYRVDEITFRIGAQIGITAEIKDPDGYLWSLVNYLDGRPYKQLVKDFCYTFPELSEEDVLKGINMLDKEGFIEESLNEFESLIEPRYKPNVNYFSRYVGSDCIKIQEKIHVSTICSSC